MSLKPPPNLLLAGGGGGADLPAHSRASHTQSYSLNTVHKWQGPELLCTVQAASLRNLPIWLSMPTLLALSSASHCSDCRLNAVVFCAKQAAKPSRNSSPCNLEYQGDAGPDTPTAGAHPGDSAACSPATRAGGDTYRWCPHRGQAEQRQLAKMKISNDFIDAIKSKCGQEALGQEGRWHEPSEAWKGPSVKTGYKTCTSSC
eukprot:1158940-Pelagomonas_calceolata.AAC.8